MNRNASWLLGLACLITQGLSLAQPAKPLPTGVRPYAARQQATSTAPVAPAGDPVLGQAKVDAERCIECHGPAGQGAEHASAADGKFPRLAGQHAGYLLKQLADFRSGRRKHDVMGLMARSVEVEDLRDIAAYLSSVPRRGGDGSGAREGARSLFLHGDPARGLPACASCHGVSALGNAGSPGTAAVPVLAGQEFLYLERQLLDWRSGWRSNGPDGSMNKVASLLSEAEISRLAAYLAGLP